MFDDEVNRHIQTEFAGMGRYADQQNKVWQAQTNEATVQRTISGAADKYNDPTMLSSAAMDTAQQIAKYGMQTGESAEIVHLKQQQAWPKFNTHEKTKNNNNKLGFKDSASGTTS